MIATAAVVALAVALARWNGGRWAGVESRGLALLILAAYMADQLTYLVRGDWDLEHNLPLQLTDAVTVVSVLALWSPRQPLVELVYFWALTASLQAVLTPDLGQTFPDVLYFTYFIAHGGVVVAACLLVFGRGLVPRPGAVPRVYLLTAGFAALAAVGDLLTGGNYMYLRDKPEDGSLLDLMGPWPWYILSAAVFGLLVFLALDRLASRLSPGPGSSGDRARPS